MTGSEANLSIVLRTLGSVRHFAKAELDHVQLLDSRSTNATDTRVTCVLYVLYNYVMVITCTVTENIIYTQSEELNKCIIIKGTRNTTEPQHTSSRHCSLPINQQNKKKSCYPH